MKVHYVIGAVLFLSSQFLCNVYAIELCEPQDYYNLANSSKCKIKYNKTGDESETREIMFEILKTYPYEKKDRFIKLLKRKIGLVDNYVILQQGKSQTEKVKSDISKLEQTKRDLSEQLEMVNAVNKNNWVRVRDHASKVLEEAAIRLQEVE